MPKKVAIAYDSKRNMISREVNITDAQQLAGYFDSVGELSGFPCEIVVIQNGEATTLPGEGSIKYMDPPPSVIARYIRGRDFSERVQTLDAACEEVKTWIDNLDEPEAIAELLQKVTGAMDVRIIGKGVAAQIAYDIPYDKE